MGTTIDITEITALLPHRYPFLLVDRVQDWEAGERLTAIKNLTMNEPFFQGHFPGRPVMPGVLMLEALAQAGAILVLKTYPPTGKTVIFLTGIDAAKFRRPVVPGDQLRLEVTVLKKRAPFWRMQGKAFVDQELACEAEVTAMVTEEKAAAQP